MSYEFFQAKLESQKYQTSAEFAEDMRLICSNCYRYNPPDSGIIQLARKLQVSCFMVLLLGSTDVREH